MSHVRILFLTLLVVPGVWGADVTPEAADARLRRAAAIAKETNNTAVLDRVLELRDEVEKAFARKDTAAAERLVRDAEAVVELDPGGKTMFGLPVAQLTPELRLALEATGRKLAGGMKKKDMTAVTAAVKEATTLLGNSTGVPDVRRKGDRIKSAETRPADLADLFVKALLGDARRVKSLAAGVPGEGTLARGYAALVESCLAVRPLFDAHQKGRLAELDVIIAGGCKAMIALQLEPGFFKFPDLRGKSLVLTEALEKLVRTDVDAVREGWIVTPVADGESMTDATECGIALLRAGAAFKNEVWTKAGLKAVEWARSAPPDPTFHANAAAVSLFAEAYRVTADKQYLTAASERYGIGVAPGQAANGRWVYPLDARPANHFLLVRGMLDLEEVLPAGKDREAVANSAKRAVEALSDEIEKLGVPSTPNTVQELSHYIRLHPDTDPNVRGWLETAATATVYRCTSGGRVRLGSPLPELAAVAGVWKK